MKMIQHVVENGKQAIVLIPEIALRIRQCFDFTIALANRVLILNSRLSQGERSDQMERVKRGEVEILTTVQDLRYLHLFENLGLIVIMRNMRPRIKVNRCRGIMQEEDCNSAREARRSQCSPWISDFFTGSILSVQTGRSYTAGIKKQSNRTESSEVYTVDMREELKHGNRSIISDKLKEMIEDRLKKRQQIMLFLESTGICGICFL